MNTNNDTLSQSPGAVSTAPVSLEEITRQMEQHRLELIRLENEAKAAQEAAAREKEARLKEEISSLPARFGVASIEEVVSLIKGTIPARAAKVTPNRSHSRAAFPPEMNAKIEEAFSQGAKPAEVAKTFGIGLSTAWLKIRQWRQKTEGAKTRTVKPGTRTKPLSEHERERAIGWIKNGKSVAWVAEHLHCTRPTVYTLLARNGIPLPSQNAA